MRRPRSSQSRTLRPRFLSRRQFRRLQLERQRRWLLLWLLTGIVLLCGAIYPVAIALAHALDEAEKPPLLYDRTRR
jgi:hypothetical protein